MSDHQTHWDNALDFGSPVERLLGTVSTLFSPNLPHYMFAKEGPVACCWSIFVKNPKTLFRVLLKPYEIVQVVYCGDLPVSQITQVANVPGLGEQFFNLHEFVFEHSTTRGIEPMSDLQVAEWVRCGVDPEEQLSIESWLGRFVASHLFHHHL